MSTRHANNRSSPIHRRCNRSRLYGEWALDAGLALRMTGTQIQTNTTTATVNVATAPLNPCCRS